MMPIRESNKIKNKHEFHEEVLGIDNQTKIIAGSFPTAIGSETIYYKRYLPHGKIDASKKIIHLFIVHGAVEYHGRHLVLPQYLLEKYPQSIAITLIDLKGHGLSSGTRSHVDNFHEFSLDVIKLLNRDIMENEISFLLGHSMGGLVSLQVMLEHREEVKREMAGLILSNPALKIKMDPTFLGNHLLRKVPKSLGAIRIPNFLKGTDLTHDSKKAKEFASDQLISRFMSLHLINEILLTSRRIQKLSCYIDLPTLFLLSGKDKISDPYLSLNFCKNIGMDLGSYRIYENMYHEIFNEKERTLAFHDLTNWLKSYF